MTMSDTGSSFAQWAALYHHHDPAGGPVLPDDDAADAGNGIGSGTATAASPTSGGSSGGSPTTKAAWGQQQLLHRVEGPRVAGKPAAARRRTRASRRAPMTLLNTDAANFRAMVQQFTGVPAPLAGAFRVGDGAPVISFAADYGFPPASSSSAVNVSFFDHQLHRSQQHHAAPPVHRQQQQYAGASPFGGYSSGLVQGGGASDVFPASAEDRMLLQSILAAQMPHMPPPVSGANTSSHGFFA
ncbi:hypothetical protein Zm00014a_038592 [Zea mays]|uniref:VQ domain-containing protein n=1 Tax=Zea mays TaxID=4577 RepID=A0A3L6EF34_MAIZE|nr:hypothetical protein Zm00014a_038592 [Zea mays]